MAHPSEKYRNWDGEYVISGMVKGIDGMPIYEPFANTTPSRHMTFIFNLFVCFQIFNLICARKIHDELNVFAGLCENMLFIWVWIIIVVG